MQTSFNICSIYVQYTWILQHSCSIPSIHVQYKQTRGRGIESRQNDWRGIQYMFNIVMNICRNILNKYWNSHSCRLPSIHVQYTFNIREFCNTRVVSCFNTSSICLRSEWMLQHSCSIPSIHARYTFNIREFCDTRVVSLQYIFNMFAIRVNSATLMYLQWLPHGNTNMYTTVSGSVTTRDTHLL